MLQADVRHLAIVDDARLGVGKTHDDGLHVVGIYRMLFQNVVDGVKRRLDRRSNRPLLDVGPRNLVALAELRDQFLRMGIGGVGLKIIVYA